MECWIIKTKQPLRKPVIYIQNTENILEIKKINVVENDWVKLLKKTESSIELGGGGAHL